MSALKPKPPGPWWPVRHEVVNDLHPALAPGDILVRLGDARILGGLLNFSKFIAFLTGSPYSHAALVVAVADDGAIVADVNETGLRRQFLIDWLDDVRGPDFLVMRHRRHAAAAPKVLQEARFLLGLDPGYAGSFDQDEEAGDFRRASLYCVQLVTVCYARAGFPLAEPVRLRDLRRWGPWLLPIHALAAIPSTRPIFHAGQLALSPELLVVRRAVLNDFGTARQQAGRAKRPGGFPVTSPECGAGDISNGPDEATGYASRESRRVGTGGTKGDQSPTRC